MTSSMLAGERRWASARRGGMTVLGKVAVPKPLNLPSQKLENHGLDPNVEIVPKGSLSWGSRPSSSTSNPWGSSAVSPNSDGNTVSPRHPSNRPTSGGGLSRPSTAGSEKMHEPSANTTTWGPNSRPSSASGVLTSNQSSLTSTRPLSAETRPGSSHLSRFAEPLFDNSMAWGPNGSTADKLSIPSKANDFSLSSGDFPTLGSEKDNTSKINESHDHGSHVRPGSASGRSAPTKERNEMSQDPRGGSGNVETWTRDGPPHMEEKWHGDPHQYVNPNVPPQHFDAWRGPPMNGPGPWYRGPPPPPAGPPYPPVPHGGYPMEPFPYYRPQIPPPLANTQPGPPPPRGHHPRNGDFYRPQMPDAFIRPGMPMRPGFYPGPVPYDGYFGPPMGYNPNDRDNPYMGLPPGPPVYNMCPPQNPSEFNDAHFRGRGFVPEQMDSLPPEETRGPYKVLRKRENERNADVDEGSWEQQTTTGNTLVIEKNDHSNPNLNTNPNSRPLFHKNDRSTDTRRNTFNDNSSSRMLVNQGHPSDSKTSNESWGKKSEILTPFPEVPQETPPNPKDPSLIQKIEGLNAKVRASEEPKTNNPTLTFGSISTTGDLATPRDINVLKADNNNNTSKSTTSSGSQISRQPHHGVRKVRSNNQETDGWRKKPQVPGSEVADQNSGENPEVKNTGEGLAPVVDPNDGQAQRARMRELAKQRAIQLQKEEEERIREQKAKALAKLEELNRRTLAADGTTQTTEGTAASVVGQEENQKETAPEETSTTKHEAMSSDLDMKVQPAVQVSEPSQQVPDQTLVSKQPEAESKTVAQPKKRNNKSSKNKPKVEEASSSEIRKPESPDNLEQVTSVPSIQNKPQHPRRTQRNPQPGNRPADRFHGNDGVVWAPVRANKEDRRDENSQKTIHDDVALPGKNDNSAQANLKNRRAEMERYVPKPVAKEQLAQQVTGQPPSPPRKSTPEDINNGEKSGSEPVVPVQTKSQSKKNHQKAGSQIETPETNVVAHEWDPSDGWFMPEYPPPAEVPPVVKDEGGGKGKGAAYKGGGGGGQRSTVKHHEAESGAEVTTDRERPVSSKENRSSQWQPKPRGWSGGGPEVKRDQANDGRRYNEEHHEGRRERKPTSSRGGRIHSPNNMEDETQQYEQQHSSSGFRKYGGGGQNNRGGDNRRQNNNNNNINRERPRQNLHYEYQPVGSNNTSNNNNNKSGNVDGGADGSGNGGGRYKERGSSQPRRGGGNFYGRQ